MGAICVHYAGNQYHAPLFAIYPAKRREDIDLLFPAGRGARGEDHDLFALELFEVFRNQLHAVIYSPPP